MYAFFPDDSYEAVQRFVDAETAVKTAHRLSEGVGAKSGFTRRIIITDGGDHTVFEWKHGEGVTFPTRAEAAS